MWDQDKAIAELQKNALVSSSRRCAQYVRTAIEAGGIFLSREADAKNYGRSLQVAGFRVVNRNSCIIPQRGDVVVIQPVQAGNPGHMAMYDGQIWISDFKQRTMYPGPEYRKHEPDFAIYRK